MSFCTNVLHKSALEKQTYFVFTVLLYLFRVKTAMKIYIFKTFWVVGAFTIGIYYVIHNFKGLFSPNILV